LLDPFHRGQIDASTRLLAPLRSPKNDSVTLGLQLAQLLAQCLASLALGEQVDESRDLPIDFVQALIHFGEEPGLHVPCGFCLLAQQPEEDSVELREGLNLVHDRNRQPPRGGWAVDAHAVPAAVLPTAAAHQELFSTMAAVVVRPLADTARRVVPGPCRPLPRHVLPGVATIDTLAAIVRIAKLQHRGDPVVALRVDECQVGNCALEAFLGRSVDRSSSAGLVNPLALLLVPDPQPLEHWVMGCLADQNSVPLLGPAGRAR